jgi:MYXO-CTERM domain-containing protein
MRSPLRSFLAAVLGVLCVLALLSPREARAAGAFKLQSTEATEVSGGWRIRVRIELPKAPLTAHQTMKFVFTKQVVFERTLMDGKSEPVLNRMPVQNATPSFESLDVDFADATGKIFKITFFDFMLTRARDYEAGEYKVELRTSDGTNIGTAGNLTLKGDNPPVDRRAIAFNAKEKSIKKVDGYDAGANQAKNDPTEPSAVSGNGEVTPTGTAKPFIPAEGYEKTPEEEIKTRPKGCGCDVPGVTDTSALLALFPLVGLGLAAARRRRRAA